MKQHWIFKTALAALSGIILWSCGAPERPQINYPLTDLSSTAFIPKPLEMKASGKAFGLSQFTGIYTQADQAEWMAVAQFAATEFGAVTGLVLPVNPAETTEIYDVIALEMIETGGPESYDLQIGLPRQKGPLERFRPCVNSYRKRLMIPYPPIPFGLYRVAKSEMNLHYLTAVRCWMWPDTFFL